MLLEVVRVLHVSDRIERPGGLSRLSLLCGKFLSYGSF
jgi:hypothetical protein